MSIRRNPVAYLALFTVLGGTFYVAVGAAAASAGGRAGNLSPSGGCYPEGSTTIAQDRVGRFFHIRRGVRRGSWYVCAFKRGMPRKLPTQGPTVPLASSAKVAGRYVAFFYFFTGRGPSDGPVAVIDMVTGHRTFSERTGYAYGGLVLKANGSVAWIASPPGVVASPQPFEVTRHDSTGTATVASGPEIDRYSLAAGGSWLYWTNARSPRSAPFH